MFIYFIDIFILFIAINIRSKHSVRKLYNKMTTYTIKP